MSLGAPIFRLSPPEKGLTNHTGADGGGTQAGLNTYLSEDNPVGDNREPFCTSAGFREELDQHLLYFSAVKPDSLESLTQEARRYDMLSSIAPLYPVP